MLNVTSRIALVCMLAAAPAASFAQSADDTAADLENTETAAEGEATTTEDEQLAEGVESAIEDADTAENTELAPDTDTETADSGVVEETDADVADAGVEEDATADADADVADAGVEDGAAVEADADVADAGVEEDTAVETETDMADADATEEATETEMADAEATPVDGQIVMQGENSLLANDLLGATVYSATEEGIGDINDMIVKLDGSIEGVVIGVGGFLGLGEKDVAISMDKLSVTMLDANTPQLRLALTAEELEAAPVFISASAQEQSAEMVEQDAAMEEEPEAADGTVEQ